jgi:ferritin-like metal-binding protein YciE
MASVDNLYDLFIHELKDLYDAEHQITQALPKMAEKAESKELKKAFEMHLNQTEKQIERLERVFEMCGEKAERKTCKGMQGLIKEGEEHMKELKPGSILDAAMIASAQRVEHYEISGYGTVHAYAEQLGKSKEAKLLNQTLEEESKTDEKLNKIAASVNERAMA